MADRPGVGGEGRRGQGQGEEGAGGCKEESCRFWVKRGACQLMGMARGMIQIHDS